MNTNTTRLMTDAGTIKNWAIDERPREKLLQHGSGTLSKAELIAILIGSGTQEESAVGVAKQMLKLVNQNLNELGKLSIKELCKIKGIGQAKAITIIAALEIGKRRTLDDLPERAVIRSSQDIFNQIYPYGLGLREERFWVIYLNQRLEKLSIEMISIGGITSTIVDQRILFRKAFEQNATHIALVHNHPSGNLLPSEADKQITKSIQHGAELLDLKLIDHLIISDNQYFSFADKNLI